MVPNDDPEEVRMPVAITTLVENSGGQHKSLVAEYGLSFLIETKDSAILFDTGQSDRFLQNAYYLRKDPATEVTQVVLSHGHYDHTGGVPEMLRATERALELHVGSGFFAPKYGVNGPALEYNGNCFCRADLEERGHAVHEHLSDVTEIADGVFVVTNFERSEDPDWANPRFVVAGPSGLEVDPFADEVAVVLKTARGVVLLVGCSHPGILNIIATVRARFSEPLYAVLGGTHLMEASGARLHRAVSAFASLENTLLGMSHCTGEAVMERLAEITPNYFHNRTGTTLIFE